MQFQCNNCRKLYPLNGLDYCCQCGGLFDLIRQPGEEVAASISLGEVQTPILEKNINGVRLLFKLDYMMPTGSFKDRGARTLISQLANMKIDEVVEDSSGNAGASIAAYCAAAGIRCNIYLPESTSPGKVAQIVHYGANIVRIPGTREHTAKAIIEAAKHTYYASHVYNPLFFEGTKSIAKEIYEQVGVPDKVVVPVGNGTMLLGVYLGFKEVGRMPRIIGVQSKNCCPVYNQYYEIEDSHISKTIAEGIAIASPKRIYQIISAIRDSDGDIVTVSDADIEKARSMLGRIGLYVEMTSGVAVAGAIKYFKGEYNKKGNILVPITGTGLKK